MNLDEEIDKALESPKTLERTKGSRVAIFLINHIGSIIGVVTGIIFSRLILY